MVWNGLSGTASSPTVAKEPVTNGTFCATMISASSLFSVMIDGVDSSLVDCVRATAARNPAMPRSDWVGTPPMIPPGPASTVSPLITLDTRLVRLGRPSSVNCAPPTTAELMIPANCADRSENPSTDISKITASTRTCVGRRSR